MMPGGILSATAMAATDYRSFDYVTLRTDVATEDTQLTAATQSTAPTLADGTVKLYKPAGAVHIVFVGTDAADETLAWTLWAYKSASSPAEYVANGTATLGATVTGTTNEYYADTIVITAEGWLTDVAVINGAPDAVVNGGGIAKLCFDTCEYEYIKVVIRDIAGGGSECSTAGAKIATISR